MKCLKGVVSEMRLGFMQIKLVNSGLKFWAKQTPTSRICRPVLVAWDYVRDEPRDVFTEDDWNIMLSARTEGDGVFSIPIFRKVEEDEVIDFPAETLVLPNQFWWHSEGVDVGDDGDGVFSIPSNDEPEDDGSEGHHNCIHI